MIDETILFYELGGVTAGGITDNISLVNVSINNPDAIKIFLHATLIYFIWRYITSLLANDNAKKAWQAFKESVRESMLNQARKKAIAYLKGNDTEYKHVFPINAPQFPGQNDDIQPIDNIKDDILSKGATYIFSYNSPSSENSYTDLQPIKIEGNELFFIKTRLLIKHILLTNLFLEFYFPFILTIIAL